MLIPLVAYRLPNPMEAIVVLSSLAVERGSKHKFSQGFRDLVQHTHEAFRTTIRLLFMLFHDEQLSN